MARERQTTVPRRASTSTIESAACNCPVESAPKATAAGTSTRRPSVIAVSFRRLALRLPGTWSIPSDRSTDCPIRSGSVSIPGARR